MHTAIGRDGHVASRRGRQDFGRPGHEAYESVGDQRQHVRYMHTAVGRDGHVASRRGQSFGRLPETASRHEAYVETVADHRGVTPRIQNTHGVSMLNAYLDDLEADADRRAARAQREYKRRRLYEHMFMQ